MTTILLSAWLGYYKWIWMGALFGKGVYLIQFMGDIMNGVD